MKEHKRSSKGRPDTGASRQVELSVRKGHALQQPRCAQAVAVEFEDEKPSCKEPQTELPEMSCTCFPGRSGAYVIFYRSAPPKKSRHDRFSVNESSAATTRPAWMSDSVDIVYGHNGQTNQLRAARTLCPSRFA